MQEKRQEVVLNIAHKSLFESMVKTADAVWCEASSFKDSILNELIYSIENLSPEEYKERVCEVFLGEDYGNEYSVGDGYHKFIRYLVDYALRFVLSERAKNKHIKKGGKNDLL